MELNTLVQFLDKTLCLKNFPADVSNNGLQIANRGTVKHIAVGVDGSLRAIRAAAAEGADFLFCHHGISWGTSLARLTGSNYAVVSAAMQNDLALYAAHLPLDAHPRYGNNAQLCEALDLRHRTLAFPYHGMLIGYTGEFAKAMTFEAFCGRVRDRVSTRLKIAPFGKKTVKRIGVISGGAGDFAELAATMGLDAFLTGETSLVGYTQAENIGMNVVFAGHYQTETFGPRAIAKLLAATFRIPVTFLDFDLEY